MGQAEDRGGAVDALVDLAFRRAAQFHGERHVVGDRHVRIERVILEHHGDVAFFGRQPIVHDAVTDADFPAGDVFEPGNHPQQRGFAAAGRPDEHDEFAVMDRNVDAMDHGRHAESLTHVADCDRSHSLLPHAAVCRLTLSSLFWHYSREWPRWNTHAEQIIPLSPTEKQARLKVAPNGGGQAKA